MPRSIIITGASSGIGRALALHYAVGSPALGLLGRNQGRLDAVADEARVLGADVRAACLDVRRRTELRSWLEEYDKSAPIDLLIANAGVMAGTRAGELVEPSDAAHALVETNVLGVLNTVQPLLPAMIARGRGQVAIIGSIAAFSPVPDAPSYSASKAAVLNYGLSLRALLSRHGVGVSVICLGYVDTPMMRREAGPKPFKMEADRAAVLIARGIARNRATVVIPVLFGMMARIGGLLPDRVRQWTARPFRFTVSD